MNATDQPPNTRKRNKMNNPKANKPPKTLNIKLDADLYDLLHNFCEVTGRTKTWVVTTAIKEWIEEVN